MHNNQAHHQTIDAQSIDAINAASILPEEKTQAMQRLITLTKNLSEIAERESQALTQADMLSFAILQDEKSMIAERYARASEEFRERLPEFRGISPALLNRLERLQHELGEISKRNNEIVSQLYKQSQQNTQETLLNVQEMGQDTKITFANTNTEGGTENV